MPFALDPTTPGPATPSEGDETETETTPGTAPAAPIAGEPGATAKKPRDWRSLAKELVKFGSVGGVSFVIDVGLYNLLVFGPGEVMAANPVTAKVITTAIATLFSWVANRLWTFREKRTQTPVRELLMFVAVNVGAMAIAAGCLYFSRWVLDLHTQAADNISGNIIGNGLGTIFRYLCYRFLVFNPRLLARQARS